MNPIRFGPRRWWRAVFSPVVGMSCLFLASLLGFSRLFWDGLAAHAFTGLAARVAGHREAGRDGAALSLLASEAHRYPFSRYSNALGVLEDEIIRDVISVERENLREAARLEAAGRLGEAFRLLGELEKKTQVPIVMRFAERHRRTITERREAAEGLLSAARAREQKGEFAAAAEVYRRILLEHPASSASRDLRLPLYVETVPPGARISVGKSPDVRSPSWISWPLGRGERLRVSADGFRSLDIGDPVGPLDCARLAAPLRVRLEPEPRWEVDATGGSIAGGIAAEEEIAVVLGADRVLRGIALAPEDQGMRIVWKRPLDDSIDGPAAHAGAFQDGPRTLVVSANKLRAVVWTRTGEDGPEPPTEPLLGAIVSIPAGQVGRRTARTDRAVFLLHPGERLEHWEAATERLRWRVPAEDGLDRVQPRDGQVILSGSSGRIVRIDAAAGTVLGRFRVRLPAGGGAVEDFIPLAGVELAPEGAGSIFRLNRDGVRSLLALGPRGEVFWEAEERSRLPASAIVLPPSKATRSAGSRSGWVVLMSEPSPISEPGSIRERGGGTRLLVHS